MCRSRQLRTNQPTGDLLTHSESLGSRSPDHRGIIRSQILEQASHLRLTFVVNQRVGGREQRASRSSRGEPVASSESSEKREEVGLHMSSGEERGDLVDRVGGLTWRSNRVVQRNVSRGGLWPSTLVFFAHLFPDEGLLDSGQVLERSQDQIRPFVASNVFREPAELFSENQQDLVFIIELILEERDQFFPRPLGSKSQSDRAQSSDGSESEVNVVGFELVHEQMDRVEGIVVISSGRGVGAGRTGLLSVLLNAFHFGHVLVEVRSGCVRCNAVI